MKRILTTLLLLSVVLVSAQKRWAVELGIGNHTIADEFVDVRDNFYHIDGVVRYNVNERFGVGLYGGYDRLDLFNVENGADTNTKYFRLTLEGVIDVFEVLHLDNKLFTVQTHGGFGLSRIDTSNNYQTTIPSFSGGVTGLVRVSERLALKADFTTTGHFNQRQGLDGLNRVNNVGINSFITNASAGIVVYLGKKKKGEHYDWYEEPKVDELATIRNKVRDLHDALLTQKPQVVQLYRVVNECKCSSDENVYFENDLPKVGTTGETLVGMQGLNAIEKIYNLVSKDSRLKVYLNGSASPTASTTKQYDLDLSKRRVEAVKAKLIQLGLDESRIETNYFGKDESRGDIHEFARKVSLMVR